MDKRRNPRFQTRFDALYASGPTQGAATLVDLSYSGARLEDVSHVPVAGTQVRLYVFVRPVAPFELVGQVIRCTGTGFAVEYEVVDPELRQLVDDVSALVAAPQ